MGLPLKRDRRFKQGYFKPRFPEKYLGNDDIIFRSGLELTFFRWLDMTPNVIKWSSETIKVPYYDTLKKRNRLYYVDNLVHIKEGDVIKKYLVEVKPFKQTQPPKESNRKKKSNLLYEKVQWENNSQGKWPAAKAFAKKHGMEFIIITEKDLKP